MRTDRFPDITTPTGHVMHGDDLCALMFRTLAALSRKPTAKWFSKATPCVGMDNGQLMRWGMKHRCSSFMERLRDLRKFGYGVLVFRHVRPDGKCDNTRLYVMPHGADDVPPTEWELVREA